MLSLAVLLLLGSIVSCSSEQEMTPGTGFPDYQQYRLVFEDDFSGSQLDTAVWNFDTDPTGNQVGWGNGELQDYTDTTANAYIQDDALVIEVLAQAGSYTSARLHTHGNKAFQYGLVEARIKLPRNSAGTIDAGVWPAFWMLGDNFNGWGHGSYGGTVPWPASGEVDILEYSGRHKSVIQALHWGGENNGHVYDSKDFSSANLISGYNVYGIVWDSQKIVYYIDGERSFEMDISGQEFSEFHKPFFLLLNIAVGGNLGGTPNPENYPQRMYVDWVRVHEKR